MFYHRALERWTVGPGPARRLGILQGVGHGLCHGVIPKQLRLPILMGFLWEFFGAWHGISMDFYGISMDFYGISMDFYGISMGSTESSWNLNFFESLIESWTIWIRLPYKSYGSLMGFLWEFWSTEFLWELMEIRWFVWYWRVLMLLL